MPEGKTVLIKVGGSLLSLKDLCARLRRLIAATEASNVFIVPGGGEITDFVRHWDRIHSLETSVSHQLAIDSLGLTARLLASLLPDAGFATSKPTAIRTSGVLILDVPAVLADAESRGALPLPAGWHVTSDSIAAWIAVDWGVDEMILAKSVDAPASILAIPQDQDRDIAEGAVDPEFGRFIADLPPVFWCDLRGELTELVALEKSPDGEMLVADSLPLQK